MLARMNNLTYRLTLILLAGIALYYGSQTTMSFIDIIQKWSEQSADMALLLNHSFYLGFATLCCALFATFLLCRFLRYKNFQASGFDRKRHVMARMVTTLGTLLLIPYGFFFIFQDSSWLELHMGNSYGLPFDFAPFLALTGVIVHELMVSPRPVPVEVETLKQEEVEPEEQHVETEPFSPQPPFQG